MFVNYTFHIDQEFDASTTMLKTNLVTKKDVAMLIIAGGGSVIKKDYVCLISIFRFLKKSEHVIYILLKKQLLSTNLNF